MPVFDQPEAVSDHRQKVHVVADKDHRAGIGGQRFDERFAAFDIEVVCRLVEDQQMRRGQGGQQQATGGPFGHPTAARLRCRPGRHQGQIPPDARAVWLGLRGRVRGSGVRSGVSSMSSSST